MADPSEDVAVVLADELTVASIGIEDDHSAIEVAIGGTGGKYTIRIPLLFDESGDLKLGRVKMRKGWGT